MIEFPDIAFDRTQEWFGSRILYWLIDWKYRKAVSLSDWLEEQVQNPTKELIEFADSINTGKTYDETVRNVLIRVIKEIKYIADDAKWEIPEKWATAHETLTLTTTTTKGTYYPAKSGDCEDGAILMYVICRLKGVPANRFLLFAGDVKGGGHCWLGYKPSFAPWLFTFMDWCYWPSTKTVIDRDKFFVMSQDDINVIHPVSNYYRVWFGFNEDVAFNKFKYKF